jgi:phospholipid/cholesterol/gamma-HCH transport system substrate-binding protein
VRRFRHTDEWVGALVIAALALFVAAVLQAGLLRDWFRPVSHLRILLPQSGVSGLSDGAEIEVLGVHAGNVRRIVLNPNQQIYAEADVERQAEPFVRRDSQAVIRRQFGVVGAAYVDISRGVGAPLDWSYAVIEATTERAPTDTINGMIDELRQKILPVLDDAKRTMSSVAAIADNLREGHGTLGRLLSDDALARHADQTFQTAQEQIAALAPVVGRLDEAVQHADSLIQGKILPILDDAKRATDSIAVLADNAREGRGTVGRLLTDDALARRAEETLQAVQEQITAITPIVARLEEVAKDTDSLVQLLNSEKEGVPSLIRHADAIFENLQSSARDISRATPYLPDIARNFASAAANLPTLLTQTQVAAAELEKLLVQLRGSWLLGGGGGQPTKARLPPTRLQP